MYGIMIVNDARCSWERRGKRGGKESQSYYFAVKLLTFFWNIVSIQTLKHY